MRRDIQSDSDILLSVVHFGIERFCELEPWSVIVKKVKRKMKTLKEKQRIARLRKAYANLAQSRSE